MDITFIFDDKDGRWIYCDYKKGITNTANWYNASADLFKYIAEAVHVFKTEKSAQKFIDEHLKYFADKDKVMIGEVPSDGIYEEKRSLKESNYDLINDDLLAMCKGSTKQLIYAMDDYQSNYSDRSLKELKRRLEEVEDLCDKILYQVNER